tara:strand:+ start:14432 stop:15250 length:819 start_codon:yes stop_codon:yes gene_type:complete
VKNVHVGSNAANDLNVVTTAPMIAGTIVEGMTIKKTTGFALLATMSISLGERNATVVAKPRKGMSKPTNPPSETTIAQTIVETDLNRNVMDETIGNAPHVATLTSHSVLNATVVESQSPGVMENLVEAFQTVVNEVAEILVDVAEVAMEAVDSVEAVGEIQTDGAEGATVAVDSVEAVGEIQTDVAEGATVAVVLVATETVVMIDVTLNEVVQAVIVTTSVQMSVIEKPEENGQAMHTTEDLNPSALDAIKARIETIEVNGRDSRSPLFGCA